MPSLAREKLYTIKEIYNLPDGERAELINGQLYDAKVKRGLYEGKIPYKAP